MSQMDMEKNQNLCQISFCSLSVQENKTRSVRQFHFHGWPEVGIPADGKGMINIIAAVQKQQQQSGNHPITVHCRWDVHAYLRQNTHIFLTVTNIHTHRAIFGEGRGQFSLNRHVNIYCEKRKVWSSTDLINQINYKQSILWHVCLKNWKNNIEEKIYLIFSLNI